VKPKRRRADRCRVGGDARGVRRWKGYLNHVDVLGDIQERRPLSNQLGQTLRPALRTYSRVTLEEPAR
jgi:hypothetical protein